MKKGLLILSLLVINMALLIGGTVAHFTDIGTAENAITTGNIDIELIETDAEGNPFENVSGILPGAKVDKVVTVKNTADNPCWVRINVKKEILLSEGSAGTPDLSLLEMDFNTSEWTESDGFFYYNSILKPGETTVPLFTAVTFSPKMGNMYAECTANVTVQAQAVQSTNNGIKEGQTVLDVAGWPMD